jgi:copper homeostasis protein
MDKKEDGAVKLEVCVDDVRGLAAAIAGGADRIELCAALDSGGLTPSPGLLRAAAGAGLSAGIPIFAMVRPRAGHFCYDAADIEQMLGDIDAIRDAGLHGVVLGAAQADGRLDHRALERLLRRADGMGATLHRVIDLCPDLAAATRTAVDLGFERILSSGGAPTAADGIDGLERCVDAAAGRLIVMPGSGIHAGNVAALRARLPLTEVHASCSEPIPAGDARAAAFGFESGHRRQTSAARVAALKTALRI